MPQGYFILVVAHSIKGRIRRIHVPYYWIPVVGVLAVFGAISVIGVIGSYSRMLMKVAHYNYLRSELDALKKRSSDLQGTISGQQQQLASLQSLASEVSMTYGLKQVTKGVSPESQDEPVPSEYRNSVEQYQVLIHAALASPIQRQNLFQDHWGGVSIPTLWPVEGPITGPFGERLDPFNGEGAFHTGVDISSPFGTPVRATADGVVVFSDHFAGYGLMIDIEHGRGVLTRYGHLSGATVSEGQAVTSGEVIGYVGMSGRSTGAHLHYEVRVNGGPVNPMRYMGKPPVEHQVGLRASLGAHSDDN